MEVNYQIYAGMPKQEMLDKILPLHASIFGESGQLESKMADKPKQLVAVAACQERVIGYKMGYELEESKFYSWLGGVDEEFRGSGIASRLMEMQHEYIKRRGYRLVRTKTMNKWRDMLILNIKHGFDVMETYIDEKGMHKIILEKKLRD
ncbi:MULTISPECIES: GNAT family N-acetyltransferase [Bacillaceae]|uniref:GNAT family N-acetyltransferase n=1 Tax=Bacillaceae TaxID=186817 RepID=UPI002964769B|nr:GNAT family N-acetyltransferase [Bacillus infantis]MDW2878524.1 GNAT family N-acetyltransferase [Bacillus infantis]